MSDESAQRDSRRHLHAVPDPGREAPSPISGGPPMEAPRPELRRPRLADPVLLRLRAEIEDSEPSIWRELEVRSDTTLDVLHQVLQASFGWTDSHLHRFAIGGHPFDRASQVFLCPFDVEETDEPEPIAASLVRLDEVLQQRGDRLSYVYDYGDNWEVALSVEAVLPCKADAPVALAVGGDRAAPPEDSGGRTDLAGLAQVVDDPEHVDLAEVNGRLRDYLAIQRLDPRVMRLVHRLVNMPSGKDVLDLVTQLPDVSEEPSDSALSGVLGGFLWFLEHACGDGLPLTSAGYLKPADVEAASQTIPQMSQWIGKRNREAQTFPALIFREALQAKGLLRKYKGTLRLTRAGKATQGEPRRVWRLLATSLIDGASDFEQDANMLVLLTAATSAGARLELDGVATALHDLGWRHRGGAPMSAYDLFPLPAVTVLQNVASPADARRDDVTSEAAAVLARAALERRRDVDE